MPRLTKREWHAVAEAIGFRLAGDTDDMPDDAIDATESAQTKIVTYLQARGWLEFEWKREPRDARNQEQWDEERRLADEDARAQGHPPSDDEDTDK